MSAASSSLPSATTRKRPAEDVVAVPRLENVIVNVRDAGGHNRSVREFLLVFPGMLTNTITREVMRMVEHQLKQKFQRCLLGRGGSDTRLVLAGAGMTVVQNVGGTFQEEVVGLAGGAQGVGQVFVPDDASIALTQHRARAFDGSPPDMMDKEPVQWKVYSGTSGLYNLLDGSFIDEDELLCHPNKGLEPKDIRAMTGYKYALLEAQVYLDERLWTAFDAAPRASNKSLKVAVRSVGEGATSGALASPVDMAVRVLAQGVPDELKPHTARVLADIDRTVDEVAAAMGEAPEEAALRAALIGRLTTLKRTVHLRAYHPDKAARSGLGVEQATTMAAWLEEVYSYILRRRLGADGGEEQPVVFERA